MAIARLGDDGVVHRIGASTKTWQRVPSLDGRALRRASARFFWGEVDEGTARRLAAELGCEWSLPVPAPEPQEASPVTEAVAERPVALSAPVRSWFDRLGARRLDPTA